MYVIVLYFSSTNNLHIPDIQHTFRDPSESLQKNVNSSNITQNNGLPSNDMNNIPKMLNKTIVYLYDLSINEVVRIIT